jgi:hypothetical protein
MQDEYTTSMIPINSLEIALKKVLKRIKHYLPQMFIRWLEIPHVRLLGTIQCALLAKATQD